MSATQRSSLSLWQQLKEAFIPTISYWVMVVGAFALFTGVVVVVANNHDAKDFVILAAFGFTTFLGVALGQVAAFASIRGLWINVVSAICWFVLTPLIAWAGSAAGEVMFIVAFCVFLFPFFLLGGSWSLQTNRAFWSLFVPVIYTTGAILTWADEMDTDERWFAGEKWAIWDVGSIAMLGLMAIAALVFLVTRETHRLALWKRGPQAPLAPSAFQEKGQARPRLTIFGALGVSVLAIGLTVGTALVAPYLWRTGPADEPDDDPDPGGQQDPEPAEPPDINTEFLEKLAEGAGEVLQKVVEAAPQAAGSLCSMLMVALMALLLFVVGWRPARRLMLMRHLRDPLWQEAPGARIEQGWRLVELALADIGVHRLPGEDAAGLARRAAPLLKDISPVEVHGLAEAAEIYDRVRFGLGVSPQDVATMDRFASWAMDTLWERQGDLEQLKNMYRGI